MKTYFDQNRLIHETDRRFHAADIELAGGFVQVVPAVADRLAPRVTLGAWSFSENVLLQTEQLEAERANHLAARRLREQRWWNQQWRRRDGLYRVRQLNAEEQALAQRLLGPDGMPVECFPRAQNPLAEDNDAQIIAQVIAVGGTLLLSSNFHMIDDAKLQQWFDHHHNEWPDVEAHKLVQRVDAWYSRWWRHERGPTVYTRAALAAFWPDSPDASPHLVRAHVEEGLSAMARGHFPTFAPRVLDHLEHASDIDHEIETVRAHLPARTRHAERERTTLLGDPPVLDLEHGAQADLDHDIGAYHR